MSKYDELLKEYEIEAEKEDQLFSLSLEGAKEMLEDENRVKSLYNNADQELNEIDEQFSKETSLNKTDVSFLMVSTALQVARWIILSRINKKWSTEIDKEHRLKHDDEKIINMEKEERTKFQEKHKDWGHTKSKKHRDWTNIIFTTVPYDVTKGSTKFGVNMEGGFHRIHTLGHDPILGWIFGPMNILSDTITLNDIRTFDVLMDKNDKRWIGITTPINATIDAIDSVKEDSKRLPAAIFAQAIHFKSDEFTKLGLPIPLLESFAPEFAGKVYKEGYDSLKLVKDVKILGLEASISIIINMIISCIHGLFYNPQENRDLYDVKTRKILSISNAIASSSNLIWVGGNAVAGNEEAIKDIDIGGLIVTMYRLVSDTKFIHNIKKEYLSSEWKNKVVGEQYSFVKEAQEMNKFNEGVKAQIEAQKARDEKVNEGLEVQKSLISKVKKAQENEHRIVKEVINELRSKEANKLYGIDINKTIKDLNDSEKKILCSALYSLLSETENATDEQKQFVLNVEQYLGTNNRVEHFNYSNLDAIDSHSDFMLVLETLCSYLFLENYNSNYIESYPWIKEVAKEKDIKLICESIEKEYSVVGVEGFVNKYIQSEENEEIKEDSNDVEEVIEVEEQNVEDYKQLHEIINKYALNPKALGKCIKNSPQSGIKEIKKQFPNLNFGTGITLSKIEKGYLLFTTYAMYIKDETLSKNAYFRIPYSKILANELSMGLSRTEGARKLIIPFINDNEEKVLITVDDKTIEEEQLRDLIKEISDSKCEVANQDFNVHMTTMDKESQKLFFKALGNILIKNNYNLVELYLMATDYGLDDSWNEIAKDFETCDLEKTIQEYFDTIPYPSENNISQQSMLLALEIICRTNKVEGKEVSMISDDIEHCVKLFDRNNISDKTYNEILKVASKQERPLNANVDYFLRERIPDDTLYKENIKEGGELIGKEIERLIKEKQNRKSFVDVIKQAADAIPNPAEIKDKIGRMLDRKDKTEILNIPKEFVSTKDQFPDDVGLPKDFLAFGMRTPNAGCLLIEYQVTEKESMPFDNNQQIIDSLHKELGDNEGLIEVGNGNTASGKKYVYDIIKHNFQKKDDPFPSIEYTVNINVKMDNCIQFINGSFAEEGTTGTRDSVIYAAYESEKAKDKDKEYREWFFDPYVPENKKGVLMNLSELAELDEQFPWHALSEARRFIKYIIDNN